MVGHGKRDSQRAPPGPGVIAQETIDLIEHVLVARAPRPDKLRVDEFRPVNDLIEAVAQEEPAHVVEVRLTAIDEAGKISVPAQQLAQREETGFRLGQDQHGIGRRRQESGRDGLQAPHGSCPGRVGALEPPALIGQRVERRGEPLPAEPRRVLRTQTLLDNDDQVQGLIPRHRGHLRMQ